MSRINPEGRLTRAERLVTVIAVIGAVVLHAIVIFGWGRMYRWAQEEQKKERLMVIRRVRDIAPPRGPLTDTPPRRQAPAGSEDAVGQAKKSTPPPPDPKVREEGPEPPKETELSPEMEEEIEQEKPEQSALPEPSENAVSVVTDLPGASFIIGGPSEFRGAGTYWVRKGAPTGTYTITFNPVAGFTTPPVQTKELAQKGQIVFVGKYRKSVEVIVESNIPSARVSVLRPDGRPLAITGVGRAYFEDLPAGNYTAVFAALPGYITPTPVVRSLVPGGKLSFFGEYQKDSSQGDGDRANGADTGGLSSKRRGAGTREADDGGGMSGSGKKQKTAAGPREAELDRRVQLIVKSYPPGSIEEDYRPIPYPEVIIRKSNFQQGWCQVYLIFNADRQGVIGEVRVERPRPDDRARFEALISAVEDAVRSWDYGKVRSEVHVDARFYVE